MKAQRLWQGIYAVCLLGSFALSLAILAHRNIYDDEITSSNLLPVPIRVIVPLINHIDVHPPGMYILSHLAFLLIPSVRWVTLLPLLCLYAGLAVFVFQLGPLVRDRTARFAFLVTALFHPQLLMWGNSIRWYPWWTGIALVTSVVALQPDPRGPLRLSWPRLVLCGILLAALFYINYMAVPFAPALAIAMLLRYGRQSLGRIASTFAIPAVLIVPQLHPFFAVHLHGSEQRTGELISIARLTQGLLESEAFVPWNPIGLIGAAGCAVLLLAGLSRMMSPLRRRKRLNPALAAFGVLWIEMFLIIALTGLGGKARNGLLLIPLGAPIIGRGFNLLRSRWLKREAIALLLLWILTGAAHLLSRDGLAKAGMIDRPEQVLSLIQSTRGDGCSVVVTYDRVLAFYLMQNRLAHQLVLTPTQNSLYLGGPAFSADACKTITEYVVRSYAGGLEALEEDMPSLTAAAERTIRGTHKRQSLSPDPDAPLKRRLLRAEGGATLPDYRYTVSFGSIAPGDLGLLRQRLPGFIVAGDPAVPAIPTF